MSDKVQSYNKVYRIPALTLNTNDLAFRKKSSTVVFSFRYVIFSI